MATPVAVILQTRLNKKDHAALKKAAKVIDVPLGTLIRLIIKEYLKNEQSINR